MVSLTNLAWVAVAFWGLVRGADRPVTFPHRLVLVLQEKGRRLRSGHIKRIASQAVAEERECSVNITSDKLLQVDFLDTSPDCDRQKLCEDLLAHHQVQSCEPDSDVVLQTTTNYGTEPDDPRYGEQWGLNWIEAPGAWAYHQMDYETTKTIVAVIDTGAKLDHPDLQPSLWTNPQEIAGNGRDDDRNGYVDDIHGWDSYKHDGKPEDNNGHGTHCAGIIGATANNDEGIAGIAQPKLMILKYLGKSKNGRTDSGPISLASSLYSYSMQKGAKISSSSYGGPQRQEVMQRVVDKARQFGHIMVIAAGNYGNNNEKVPMYPCNYKAPNVICVAASWKDEKTLTGFSNYGKSLVQVAAPGQQILSTYINPLYTNLAGTSMAAPLVAGLVALVWDFRPKLLWSDVVAIVVNTADPKFKDKVTCGRINARRAMAAAKYGHIPRTCGQYNAKLDAIAVPKILGKKGSKNIRRRVFAAFDNKQCAEAVPYGDKAMSKASSPFFSTRYAHHTSDTWVQKIHPYGIKSHHDIEIEYKFPTLKTLVQRMQDAVTKGEEVKWTIKHNNKIITKSGKFWFSDNASFGVSSMTAKLAGSGSTGLSGDDGAWGAATGPVNGNCDPRLKGDRKCPADFWGIINDNDQDRTSCYKLYTGDYAKPRAYPNMRTIMYMDAHKPVIKESKENKEIIARIKALIGEPTVAMCALFFVLSCGTLCFCIRCVLFKPLPKPEGME